MSKKLKTDPSSSLTIDLKHPNEANNPCLSNSQWGMCLVLGRYVGCSLFLTLNFSFRFFIN